ncbi:MAG: hypothetical protein RIR79_1261 [Pseudomonadota bacterium]
MNVEPQCDKFVTEMCENRRFTARMGGMRNAQAAEILNRWCASGKDWQTRAALPTSLLFSKNKPRWGRR